MFVPCNDRTRVFLCVWSETYDVEGHPTFNLPASRLPVSLHISCSRNVKTNWNITATLYTTRGSTSFPTVSSLRCTLACFFFGSLLLLNSCLSSTLFLCTVLSPFHPLSLSPLFFSPTRSHPFLPNRSTIFIPRSFPWFLPGIILIHIHPFQSLLPSLSLSFPPSFPFCLSHSVTISTSPPPPKPRPSAQNSSFPPFIIFYTILNPRISPDLLS